MPVANAPRPPPAPRATPGKRRILLFPSSPFRGWFSPRLSPRLRDSASNERLVWYRHAAIKVRLLRAAGDAALFAGEDLADRVDAAVLAFEVGAHHHFADQAGGEHHRSEEHTSELQS